MGRFARKDVMLKFPFADRKGTVKELLESQAELDESTTRRRETTKKLKQQVKQAKDFDTGALRMEEQKSVDEKPVKKARKVEPPRKTRPRWDRSVHIGCNKNKFIQLEHKQAEGPVLSSTERRKPPKGGKHESILQLVDRLCASPLITSFIDESNRESGDEVAPPDVVFCDLYGAELQKEQYIFHEGPPGFSNIWGAPEDGCVTPTSSIYGEDAENRQAAKLRLYQQLAEDDEDDYDDEDDDDDDDDDENEDNMHELT